MGNTRELCADVFASDYSSHKKQYPTPRQEMVV